MRYRQVGDYYRKLTFMGNLKKVAEGHVLSIKI